MLTPPCRYRDFPKRHYSNPSAAGATENSPARREASAGIVVESGSPEGTAGSHASVVPLSLNRNHRL
jgi:hypothetical protein